MAANPLAILSELGALKDPITNQVNLIDLKPFFDWTNNPLRNTILTMRLLNVGELEDIEEYLASFAEGARKEKRTTEILIRSVWRFNGVDLCRKEDLDLFNKDREGKEFTELEYKRWHIRNFEVLVRDRLDAIYAGMQHKQVRALQGYVMCHVTGKLYPIKDIPEGSIRIRYSLAEIIAGDAYKDLSDSEKEEVKELMRGLYKEPIRDAEDVAIADAQEKVSIATLDNTYRCRYCSKEFPSEQDVLIHVEKECTRVGIATDISEHSTQESFTKVPDTES